MPNNLEAEQALLGCLLIDIDTQTDILDKLTEEDFYQESHKLIIGAMKRVFNERKPVDLVTLSAFSALCGAARTTRPRSPRPRLFC